MGPSYTVHLQCIFSYKAGVESSNAANGFFTLGLEEGRVTLLMEELISTCHGN